MISPADPPAPISPADPPNAQGRLIHTGQALVDAVAEVPALPRRGGNTMATSYTRYAGGAVNTLVAAARCGGRAVHAGTIGTGPDGDLIREVLAAERVEVSSPAAGPDTGTCIVLVEPSGERTFITTTGAERLISVDSLQTSQPRPGDAVCVTGYSLALASTRDPLLDWLEGLPDGVDVILDPGDVAADLPPAVLERMLALTTVWTGNAEESTALASGRRSASTSAGRDADPLSTEALQRCASRLPAGCVVITRDGPRGCAVLAEGRASLVPGFPQRAVDTNGAGDVHTGALIAARLAGKPWPDAARWANAAAAITVTRRGPDTAPRDDEITRFLARVDLGWVLAQSGC
ncbi:PfkB family carbohydrate kinase [Acidipropionibacterium acidipropionici]|uniref:PfkB family carbohydrate kinase n=1 Tax=Acidipropionibacterium acidipropionici TaxID=1748 RepID=UPI00110A9A9D|nr:PfkB family carbohydrate kinase [Acidipropionibacterium acidipropionici]QCV96618.1 sugar kinase [Acidipropionibacterium acidipropionici]